MDSRLSRLKSGASRAKQTASKTAEKAKQTEEKVGDYFESGVERHRNASREVSDRMDNAAESATSYADGRIFPETGDDTNTGMSARSSFYSDSDSGSNSRDSFFPDSGSSEDMGMSPGGFGMDNDAMESNTDPFMGDGDREFPFRF